MIVGHYVTYQQSQCLIVLDQYLTSGLLLISSQSSTALNLFGKYDINIVHI